MKFNSQIKYKTKPKLLHLLLSLILTISMITPIFTSQPLQVQAEGSGDMINIITLRNRDAIHDRPVVRKA